MDGALRGDGGEEDGGGGAPNGGGQVLSTRRAWLPASAVRAALLGFLHTEKQDRRMALLTISWPHSRPLAFPERLTLPNLPHWDVYPPT